MAVGQSVSNRRIARSSYDPRRRNAAVPKRDSESRKREGRLLTDGIGSPTLRTRRGRQRQRVSFASYTVLPVRNVLYPVIRSQDRTTDFGEL